MKPIDQLRLNYQGILQLSSSSAVKKMMLESLKEQLR